MWPRFAGVALVLVLGTLAAWAAARAADRSAADQERLVADQTASVMTASVQQVLAAISGASGLPDTSGEVDEMRFRAFATAATRDSPITTLAFVPVVPATERADFEAAIGRSIVERPGGPPAPRRAGYLPVRWVVPSSGEAQRLIGYDLATEPVRRAAAKQARDRGTTIISPTVEAQPNGEPSVFLAHPVYRPGTSDDATAAERRRAIVGYVTTAVHGDTLLAALDTHATGSLGIRIDDVPAGSAGSDGKGMVLAESNAPPQAGTTVVRTVGGRAWRITVDDRHAAATRGPWSIMAGTVALAAALALLAWRAMRHQRQVARHVATVERIADLGRSLTSAGSVDELSRVVVADVPAVLGADAAHFWELGVARDDPVGPGRFPGTVVRRWITDDAGTTVASLEVAWTGTRQVDDLTKASLSTVAEMCGQTLVRARLGDRVRRDAVSSRLLAGLAEAATTAGTTDHVARTLAERAAEVAGAAATDIGLLADDGRSLVVVRRGVVDRTEILPVEAERPLAEAFRGARPVLLGDAGAIARRFPGIAGDMRASGLAAAACLPLVGDDGRAFGALGLVWQAPRRFDPELEDILRTTADLCASSLERARATDRAQARSSAMATLASHLSASTSFEDVGTAIIEHATAALGADFALVGVVEGDRFHLLAPSGPQLDVLAPYMDIDLGGDFPALLAWRRRELVAFESLDDMADPEVSSDLARMGLHGGACAPLLGGDGTATGAFTVLWAEPPPLDGALRARIATVADLCAQSVERSRLFDAEHRVRRDIERSVLADAPQVAGLDVATRYRPAAQSLGMGGDWYDAVTLEGGRLCLVVGDVSGHGVPAIAEMTQIRTVVHTLAAGGMPLSEILTRTTAVMQRDRLGYATVLIAVADLRAGSVEYVTAGHPPPMLRRPGGTIDTLTGGRHSVLGIDVQPKPAGYVSFPVGSTLVIYTDGLIERRDAPIDVSIVELADQLRAAPADSAGELADALLDGIPPAGSARDDVALVVARRTG